MAVAHGQMPEHQLAETMTLFAEGQIDVLVSTTIVESGLDIAFVELREVKAPAQVKKYFDDVINASIDRNKTINLAQTYRNEQLPAARGRAFRLQEEAEAYKNKTVAEAVGNTKRFLDLLSEYAKSKNITRRRLLIDTMRDVFSRLKKVYVVAPREGEPAKLKIFKK